MTLLGLLHRRAVPSTNHGPTDGWLVPELAVLLTDNDGVPRLLSGPGGLSATNYHPAVTASQWISSEALGTRADGSVVAHLTLCIVAAGSNARIPAVVVKAGQAAGTLIVVLTVSSLTERVGISLVSRRTLADRLSTIRSALCTGSTGTWVTWTRLFNTTCDCVRLRDVSGQALTDRVAQAIHLTPCVPTTGAREAWVRWRRTSFNPSAACNGVWLRGEAGQAGTDRVALSVYITLSIGSTRGGLTGVRSGSTLVVITNIVSVTVSISLTLSATAGNGVRLRYISWQAATNGVS